VPPPQNPVRIADAFKINEVLRVPVTGALARRATPSSKVAKWRKIQPSWNNSSPL
jgi:hypothetical protein